ncbi:MAG: hypothetical protein JRC57_09345, partial [Deltaproteobacteria bacterium]|nr:hypothetical protein [Deltaproteobacteria bacterium]
MSKRNLSPFPNSTKKQAAACLGRALGIPVPQAVILISSGARSSVPGKYMSRSGKALVGEILGKPLAFFASAVATNNKSFPERPSSRPFVYTPAKAIAST